MLQSIGPLPEDCELFSGSLSLKSAEHDSRSLFEAVENSIGARTRSLERAIGEIVLEKLGQCMAILLVKASTRLTSSFSVRRPVEPRKSR